MNTVTDTENQVFEALFNEGLSNRGWLEVREATADVKLLGLSTGKITILQATHVPGLGVVLTLHETGHHYWAARGSAGYAGATIQTVLVRPTAAASEAVDRWIIKGILRFQYVQLSREASYKTTDDERTILTRAALTRFRGEVV